jgi:uncharacterized protein YprB with RNaseH-like and TPR domain
MLTPRLRRRLSELARTPAAPLTGLRGGLSSTPSPLSRSASTSAPTRTDTPSHPEPPERLNARTPERLTPLLLPFDPAALGAEREADSGRCYCLTIPVAAHLEDAAERAERLHAAIQRLAIPPESLLLVDIETAGLTAAPLFLVGALSLGPDGLTLTQYFARGYEEEPALLDTFCRSLAPCRMVVTFNGESFDLPYLRDRAIYHRLPPPIFPDHLDLLPAARRAFRGRVPNCRLQTLELHVCRRCRTGDVPGDAIPSLYHDFVRTGSWPLLLPVFHHNALDLLTLAELLPRLLEVPAR